MSFPQSVHLGPVDRDEWLDYARAQERRIAALEKVAACAHHAWNCAKGLYPLAGMSCTCGLDAARKAAGL